MGILRVTLSELKRLTAGILPKLVLLAMACIPLLYGGIYLYANWDPYGTVDEVPGALVMQDAGAENSSGEHVNTGQEVADNLKESADFQWHDVQTRDEAVEKVANGDYSFALIIPSDFSKNLQSAGSFKPDDNGNVGEIDPESAGIEVITNDANNYILTSIVNRAGTAVRDTVASKVGNETANQLLASFTTIHSNISDAADGAQELDEGSVKLTDALDQVKDGSSSLANGTLTLKDGTIQLRDGSGRLVDGQKQLADGSGQLAQGADKLSSGVSDASLGVQQLADGSAKLYGGTQQLSTGASDLAAGTQKLSDGGHTLSDSTGQLSTGASDLANGTGDLASGASQLADGTAELNQKIQDSGIGKVGEDLNKVCADLSSAENSPNGAAQLTDDVTARLHSDMQAQLAPLVADGTLTQEQADQILGRITSEQTKADLTTVNQNALDKISDGLGRLGSSCAIDGTSAIGGKIGELTSGVAQLNDGAHKVSEGAAAAHDGATKLSDGASKLNDGAQQLSAGIDSANDGATKLSDGASKLNDGAQQLSAGIDSANDGAHKLASGSKELETNTGKLADGAAKLAGGTLQLSDGSSTLAAAAHQLNDGQQSALAGTQDLANGAAKLDDGATDLHDGAVKLDDGTGKVQSGAQDLSDGANQLHTGLSDGVKKIPSLNESQQNAVADTMSNPVNLHDTSLASGDVYGEGMGPFFMVLALWIGALMLVQTMRPENTRALASNTNSARITVGAWGPFAVVGILQTILLYAVVDWVLGFDFAHPFWVFVFLGLVSLVYTAIIYGFVALLAAPGKLLALIVLIIQLVTAGGMMPYQTLPESIRWLHYVLPMGWALSGVRRLAYGIDLGAMPGIIAVLLLWGFIGLLLGYIGTRRSRTWTLKTLNPEIAV